MGFFFCSREDSFLKDEDRDQEIPCSVIDIK